MYGLQYVLMPALFIEKATLNLNFLGIFVKNNEPCKYESDFRLCSVPSAYVYSFTSTTLSLLLSL